MLNIVNQNGVYTKRKISTNKIYVKEVKIKKSKPK